MALAGASPAVMTSIAMNKAFMITNYDERPESQVPATGTTPAVSHTPPPTLVSSEVAYYTCRSRGLQLLA